MECQGRVCRPPSATVAPEQVQSNVCLLAAVAGNSSGVTICVPTPYCLPTTTRCHQPTGALPSCVCTSVPADARDQHTSSADIGPLPYESNTITCYTHVSGQALVNGRSHDGVYPATYSNQTSDGKPTACMRARPSCSINGPAGNPSCANASWAYLGVASDT